MESEEYEPTGEMFAKIEEMDQMMDEKMPISKA